MRAGSACRLLRACPPPTPCHHPFAHPACRQIAGTVLGSAEAAAAVDADVLRRLKADVAMRLNALRNASYAGGFAAAKGAIAAAVQGQYA